MWLKKNKKIQKQLAVFMMAAVMFSTGCGIALNVPTPSQAPSVVPKVINQSSPTPELTEINTSILMSTSEPTATSTLSPTLAPTATGMPSPTSTNTPKPTATSTPVPTPTNTPSPTPTSTPKPMPTNTPVPTPTNTPVPTATSTPKPTPTNTPSPTPQLIVITTGTNEITIGTSIDNLTEEIGMPDYTMPAEYADCEWYVYNRDYTNLTIVLVQGKKIVGTYVDSMEFSYKDITTETTPDKLKGYKEREKSYVKTEGNIRQIVFIDTLGDNTAEGILIIDNKVYSTLNVAGKETALEQISFEVTNSFRAKNGLYELEWCEEVAVVARKHSEDMKNNNFFAHESLDGTEFSDRISYASIDWWSCAENIAAGYTEGFQVTYGWINSSGHRRNILNSTVERLGVGAVKGGSYGTYYTQDFYSLR